MTEPLSPGETAVLTVLAGRGSTWQTRDQMIHWSRTQSPGDPLAGMTPRAVSLAGISLQRRGYASRIKSRGAAEYKITATGRLVLRDEVRRDGPPADATRAAIDASREKAVMTYEVKGAAGGPLRVIVTDRASILLDCPTEAIKLAVQGGVDELFQVLEQAKVDQHRIARQLHPSALRKAIRALLADCPRTELAIQRGLAEPEYLVDLRGELARMETDGEVTRPGACYRLTVKAQQRMAG